MFFLPYIFLAFVLFFLYLNEKGRIHVFSRKSAIWIAYIIMWAFVGLRGHMNSDFIVYYPYFEKIPDIFHFSSKYLTSQGFEIGFNIYTSIIKTITPNYFAWVAINTLIDFIVFAWFFRKYTYSMILPLIFMIAFQGVSMEFNLYRNIKGVDCFLLSVPFLLQRRILPYMLLNLLGTMFHSSSLLYFFAYFFINREMKPWFMWTSFIVANIIFIFGVEIISEIFNNIPVIKSLRAYDKIAFYKNSGDTIKFSVGYFERLATYVLFTCYYTKMVKDNKANRFFYNCYWCYYCFFLIFYEVQVFVERVPLLFIFSYWILYPALLRCKTKYRKFIQVYVFLLVLLKIGMTFKGVDSKYENVLTGITPYNERATVIKRLMYEMKK